MGGFRHFYDDTIEKLLGKWLMQNWGHKGIFGNHDLWEIITYDIIESMF